MGKQVLFYMSPADESNFIKFVHSTGDVVILPPSFSRPFNESSFGPKWVGLSESGGSYHIWNRAISRRPAVLHYPERGYYCIDPLQSEVINLLRSNLAGNELSMGRLQMETKLLGPHETMISKSEAFDHWFAALRKWLRQKSVMVIDGACVLQGAEELKKSGIQLTGHKLW